MKPHITNDQWEELSINGKNIWRRWSYDNGYVEEEKDKKSAFMPMPSVLQMIQYLEEKQVVLISSAQSKGKKIWITNGHEAEELCDALWEYCKTYLV